MTNPWQPTEGESAWKHCYDCAGVRGSWRISNHLWRDVMGEDGPGVCPVCFMRRARAKHIGERGAWILMPPRLTITDPETRRR